VEWVEWAVAAGSPERVRAEPADRTAAAQVPVAPPGSVERIRAERRVDSRARVATLELEPHRAALPGSAERRRLAPPVRVVPD
jgi:hypothetical protein